ncbi:hypothetical protein CC86DRAFT_413094 [Ophiobolus disseminans]|uniref:Uncharacterized protein n=1 Tax=Ophiobolus disseminans TaxID=1469910 RepID=A0A6A6ZEG2_9PLEO|nr:hypothetical protein CC86DRAFT_413094 [Ophiobolus disseminans]
MPKNRVHQYIQGAVAQFDAGCELKRFDLSPDAALTSNVSIKADANSILVAYHNCPEDRQNLYAELQKIGRLRYFRPCTRWGMTMSLGFFQPEHALRALSVLKSVLDLQACLLYTIYVTAPKEISDAVSNDINAAALPRHVDVS